MTKWSIEKKGGITLSITPIHPATASPKDSWSAKIANEFMNHITLSPLINGRYPEELRKRMKLFTPKIHDKDMALIQTKTDFLGINFYSREMAMYKWYIPFLKTWTSGLDVPEEDFENGGPFTDIVDEGAVHDEKRIRFMKDYLEKVNDAISEGADVRAYFYWSLLDNFEWAEGLSKRFGLIHVDHNTQKRIIKDSGYWYRDFLVSQKN